MTQRSIQQNKSLHKYLEQIAEQLASSGQDMRQVVKLPIKPTMENVKENMFKPVMSALYPDKESTTELTTTEMQECYQVFNEAIAQRLGVSADWPCEQSMYEEAIGFKKRQ